MKKTVYKEQLKNKSVDIDKMDIHFNREDAPPKTNDQSEKTKDKRPNQNVGSGKGGAYPYNINSNTSDETNETIQKTEFKQNTNNTFNKQEFIDSHKKNTR